MVRRLSTTVAALAVAMLIYCRLRRHHGPRHCRDDPRLPDGRPAKSSAARRAGLFGIRVPVSSVVAASVTLLAMPLTAEFMTRLRRRPRLQRPRWAGVNRCVPPDTIGATPLHEVAMTLAQVEKRLVALEKRMGRLQETLDYQQAVEGIRRGLESADSSEGNSVTKTFADLRRKHGLASRRTR
jgi:hypothetical protein